MKTQYEKVSDSLAYNTTDIFKKLKGIKRKGKVLKIRIFKKQIRKTRLTLQCDKEHKWETSYDSLVNHNSWCPQCAKENKTYNKKKNIKNCEALARKRGFKLISKVYIKSTAPLEWKCKCGCQWKTSFSAIQIGQGCPECAIKNNKGNSVFTLKDLHKYAKQNKGKCLSKEYKSIITKYLWECDKRHRWRTTFEVVKKGHWCSSCSKYKKENNIRKIFERIFGGRFNKVRPDWLRNPETGFPLELDGYNKDLKIAFEYQGQQHYKLDYHNRYNKKTLANIKKRDQAKKKLCKENGIKLIPIKHDRELEYIKSQLIQHKDKILLNF